MKGINCAMELSKNKQNKHNSGVMFTANIYKLYREFPGIGRKIKIEYPCEYVGVAKGRQDSSKRVKRRAKILKKIKHKNGAFFTVEILPENVLGKRGRYRLSFHFADLLTGRIKILEVE